MSDNLKKLKQTLATIEIELAKYKELFLADGRIDKDEQAKLDHLENQVKTVQEKIIAVELENGDLDTLYEIVIESNKKAESKPTIENKKVYQKALETFNQKCKRANPYLRKLWKNAQNENDKELAILKENLEKTEATKERIANLEKVESAKIYCIIKGTNPDGTQWGRIDFVGANYVDKVHNKVEYAGKVSNKIPLLVKYYSYENGDYTYLKDSNSLETAFDKQLMDTFLKAGKVSYEQYKNLGRDYEYTPKNAAVMGSGDWYINVGKIAQEKHVEKVIEVPDWNDFGFQNLYDEYLDKCSKGILPPEDRDDLKNKMQGSISKQKKLVEELKKFHTNENDQDNNTTILVDVWIKKIGNFEEEIKGLKNDCFRTKTFGQPCKDFDTTYDKHEELCRKNALPKRVGDSLKSQMQDCIDDDKKLLVDKQTEVNRLKKVPNWESKPTIKTEVEKLEKEIGTEKKKLKEQEDKLAALPEECIQPIMLEITFDANSNKIKTKDDAQLKVIADFLNENPSVKIKLIGNTSMNKKNTPKATMANLDDFKEDVPTDHIMPNDTLSGNKATDEAHLKKEKLKAKKDMTKDDLSLTISDLMMIRTERIKQILVKDLKVNPNQITTVEGKNLGKGKNNQKVILEYH